MTNINRMEALLARHPLVDNVMKWKVEKALDKRAFDANGRAILGHQSRNDLCCSLAATGAMMDIGCTTNDMKALSIAVWWRPRAPYTVEDIALSWE